MADLDPKLTQAPKGAKIIDFDDEEFDQFDQQAQEAVAQPTPTNHHINPLQKHFRVPGISIHLPSGTHFYQNQEVELNMNGEIDIYPMTAGDEVLLKNPDALLSGRAIEMLVQSCVPQVNNVRRLISQDIDAIILAIRAASSSNANTTEPNCPKCGTENLFEIDLNQILDSITTLKLPHVVKISPDLSAEIRPYNFEEQTKAAITAFEEGKRSQLVAQLKAKDPDSEETNDTMNKVVSDSINRIVKLKYALMANSIQKIIASSEEVTEKQFIVEFLENAPRTLVDKLVKAMEEINNIPPYNSALQGQCINCGHQWEINIDFNPSNFFA